MDLLISKLCSVNLSNDFRNHISTISHNFCHSQILCRIRWVLKRQLNGLNKIQALNTCIITWPKEEKEPTDIKIKKLLTMYGGFHPKSSTLRLYTKQREGGWGLVCIEATIPDKTAKIWENITIMQLLSFQNTHMYYKMSLFKYLPWFRHWFLVTLVFYATLYFRSLFNTVTCSSPMCVAS